MLLNMKFSLDELHFIFSEIRRVLKPNGLNFFSVRNHNDKSYGKGKEIDKEGIYDINGFQIRFFTEKEIQDLTTEGGFELLWIKEEYEEPVTLYLVSSRKKCECCNRGKPLSAVSVLSCAQLILKGFSYKSVKPSTCWHLLLFILCHIRRL
jgi:SAM-dependent methyltransferase